MKSFLTAYSLECKKIFTAKGLWIFVIVMIVLSLLTTLSFSIMTSALEGLGDVGGVQPEQGLTAEQAAEMYRLQLEEYRAAVESGEIKQTFYDNTETTLKMYIAVYDFLAQKGIEPSKVGFITSINLTDMSSVDYVMTMSAMILEFAALMCIVLSAKSFAGENDKGTLRMLLTRPISRHSLLAAKQLSVFTAGAVVSAAFTLVYQLVGLAFFDGSVKDIVLVDSYANVALINPYTAIFLQFLIGLVVIAVFVEFTFFAGNFMGSTASLVLPLVYMLAAEFVSALLMKTGLPWIGLMTNLKWANALAPGGLTLSGMSIYTMIAVSTVWFALFTVSNYILFAKRDIK